MGLVPVAEIDKHPAVEVMAELLARNKAWVKLSGTYNAPGAREGQHHAGFARLVQRLCAANSAHLVWGSDWPHPTLPVAAKPDAAALLDMLLEWFPDESQRLAVLLDNPVTLYDFRD
jgi:predicted TIM-barrel fold metal-dependent hydrolase